MPYDSRYPPEHTTYNTTAPLRSITAEDYVPDQQATKRKRAQRIKDLILFVVIAVFLGSILYVSLIATKTNDNDKSRFASTAQPVNAQITNIRFKKPGSNYTNGDSVYFWQCVTRNPGIAATYSGSNPGGWCSSSNVNIQGMVVGLNGLDWDSAYANVSGVATYALWL